MIKVNRLTEYIIGQKSTRQFLQEARIKLLEGKDRQALQYTIEALDSFIKTMNCVVSLQSGRKVKKSIGGN